MSGSEGPARGPVDARGSSSRPAPEPDGARSVARWRGRGRLSAEVPASGEAFHALAVLDGARIEHIVSSNGPDTALQVQGWDEWVLVLSGDAELEVAGQSVELTAGEWLLLPAGTPHRVRRTEAGTHWLAVHGVAGPGEAARGVAQPAEAPHRGAD